VQFAAEIRQGLDVSRFRPQRASDPLTLNWTVARMQDEKGNELLLPRPWHTGERAAAGHEAKASEQLDAQRGWSSHGPRLHVMGAR
jgi:hypothetical protein